MEHIHDDLLHIFWPGTEYVDSQGVKNRGLLESAVARPFQSAFGEDAYPQIVDKAVALFHSLIANHPFHDGNKRTAVTALQHFLLANGFILFLRNAEAYEAATYAASYRERGTSHGEVVGHLRGLIESHMLSLDVVEQMGATGSESFRELLEQSLEFRARIRRSKMNALVPLL